VAVVGERRCGKTCLAEALRRSAAAREAAAAAGDSSTDVDDLAGTGSGWCRLDVVDLSAGRHFDVYGRGLDVDAYILAFDVTSIQAAGSAHHNGTAAALTSRHAARLQMWLQALYEVCDNIITVSYPLLSLSYNSVLVTGYSYRMLFSSSPVIGLSLRHVRNKYTVRQKTPMQSFCDNFGKRRPF